MNHTQKTISKVYRGSPSDANHEFQADLSAMEEFGYFPISQTWSQGSWSHFNFFIALLLCFIAIGFFIFLYMLVVKPDGYLTVLYRLDENFKPTLISKAINENKIQRQSPLYGFAKFLGVYHKEVFVILTCIVLMFFFFSRIE